MTTVTLRGARPDAASMLSDLALAAKGFWGYDQAFIESCRDELSFGPDDIARRHFVVADLGGLVAGCYSVNGDPPVGELGNMWDQAEQDRHRPRPGPVAGRDGHAWPTGCVRLMRSSDIARPIRCWSPLPRGAHRGCPRVTDKTIGTLLRCR